MNDELSAIDRRVMEGTAVDETERTSNLALWSLASSTDKGFTSQMQHGAKLTAIDQTYQKKRATALWGPFGQRWGLKDVKYGYVPEGGTPMEIWLEAIFYWPGGEFQVSTDMKWRADWDCRLKLRTHAWKKALSDLGFSADIHMGKFEDEKYVDKPADDRGPDRTRLIEQGFTQAKDVDHLERMMAKAKTFNLTEELWDRVQVAYEIRKSAFESLTEQEKKF